MNVEDYRIKTQKISNLLSLSTCPEDILNCKDIDLKNDFQYLCFSCSCNIDLVDDVIARLAIDGNRDIVEQNVNHITINMWKDLFNKNDVTKELFIKNYNNITENAGIITYREIEGFVDDEQTRPLIYSNLPLIIKKLCTYDRASLIKKLKTKQDGIDKIKDNIEIFFQKGEFDISTTYSKVLIELNDVPGISKIEILEACSKHLIDMLERETAIDNETNDLLDWIYDSMEETKMFDEQRKILQNYIDNAILDNFDSILDKSNYDKVTIKILKQFPCTYNRFENKKNLYIDKSNEKLEMTKSIGEDYTMDNTKVHTINVEFVNDKYTSDTENDANSNDEDVKMVVGNYEIDKVENNSITYNENICQIKGNHAIDEKDELKNNGEDIEVLKGNHAVDCEKNITVNSNDIGVSGSHAIDDIYNHKDERNKITIESEQKEVEHTKFVQENENQSQAIYNKVDYKEENIENEFEDLNVLAKFSELMEKNNENDSSGAGDYISNLIKNNIQETDRIIAQILKKDVEHTTQNSVKDNAQDEIKTTEVQNVIQNQIKDETEHKIQNITQNETQNNCTWSEISKDNTLSIETTNAILMEKEEQAKDIVHNETIEKNEEKQALMVREEDIALPNQNSFFAKIWNKVKKLFAKLKTYRIGE